MIFFKIYFTVIDSINNSQYKVCCCMPDYNAVYFYQNKNKKNKDNHENLEKQSPGSEREKKGAETRRLSWAFTCNPLWLSPGEQDSCLRLFNINSQAQVSVSSQNQAGNNLRLAAAPRTNWCLKSKSWAGPNIDWESDFSHCQESRLPGSCWHRTASWLHDKHAVWLASDTLSYIPNCKK